MGPDYVVEAFMVVILGVMHFFNLYLFHRLRKRGRDGGPRPRLAPGGGWGPEGAPVGGDKPVQWWDGPKPEGKVTGTLKQVDCLPKQQARLFIEAAYACYNRLNPQPALI